jgi:hypothetical protein
MNSTIRAHLLHLWRLLPLLGIALALPGHALATAAAVEHYVGKAFDMSGRLLYTESHWIHGDPGARELLVLFRCPDGRPFARKRVREAGHEQAPSFLLEDARSGYREGVREDGPGQREVFVRAGADEPERRAPVAGLPGLVVDAGFDSFLREHWKSLAAGQPQRFEFLLPSRLQAYPFSLSQSGDDLIDGTPVRRFRLQLDAWYAFAVPAISLAYERDTKRIREYTGISNIRNATGKSLKVRIEFPPSARTVLPDARRLDALEKAELDGTCAL